MAGEIVRALRVVEFIGTREFLDRQARQSSWTERQVPDGVIKAAWIGITPGSVAPEEQEQERLRQAMERRRNRAMQLVNDIANNRSGLTREEYVEIAKEIVQS